MESDTCTPTDLCPSHLTPGFKAFDPVRVAEATERVVCKGNKRRYSRFGWTINYKTGIATGYVVGCCLRCIYCWASETRDRLVKTSDFYSPQEAFERLTSEAKKKHLRQIRISDAEPTIGKEHLLELIELVERSEFDRFVLETNGILFGVDKDYVRSLSQFRKVYIRVSLKAGTASDFTQKTGAAPEAFDLPFQAIRHLRDEGLNFSVAAMSADPRFMSPEERISLIGKLASIDPALALNLEEEMVVLYPDTVKRIEAMKLDSYAGRIRALERIPVLGRFLQVSYQPVSTLARKSLVKSLKYSVRAFRELYHGT